MPLFHIKSTRGFEKLPPKQLQISLLILHPHRAGLKLPYRRQSGGQHRFWNTWRFNRGSPEEYKIRGNRWRQIV